MQIEVCSLHSSLCTVLEVAKSNTVHHETLARHCCRVGSHSVSERLVNGTLKVKFLPKQC